jgi:hypothetical protein
MAVQSQAEFFRFLTKGTSFVFGIQWHPEFNQQQDAFEYAWSLRADAGASDTIGPALREALGATAGDVLQRLYPEARVDV